MTHKGLIIRHLVFTGPNVKPADLDFQLGSNLIYGASNTGKSFTLKSLDFMFGGQEQLPYFNERKGYEGVWLGFTLEGVGDFTLFRAISGGSYKLYNGLVKSDKIRQKAKILSSKHNPENDNNLSQFLLKYLELSGKLVAKNVSGERDGLSFRDLVKILLVNETNIQMEMSPIESGNSINRTKERSVFRLLLTDTDDSSIVTNVNENTFKTSKTARLEMVGEMISNIESKLAENYQDIDVLPARIKLLDEQFEQIQMELKLAQEPIIKLIEKKRLLSIDISKTSTRLEEIQLHVERFKQLEEVYLSDIERLRALEEASFILSLNSDLDCPLCGAPAEMQKHTESLRNIGEMQNASLVEIKKIELQRSDLLDTVHNLESEKEKLKAVLEDLKINLEQVEKEISLLIPDVTKNHLKIRNIIEARDHARKGLSLLEQRNELFVKREELNNLKKPSRADNPKLSLPADEINEFCKVVSNVLKQWEFPGDCNVSFDYKTYDLRVDGKLRVDNGKGVRAIIHAAFKIALLLFCRDRGLPHPGFIVLDTPLLTYRDPMKNPRLGDLTDDEKALAKTSVKERFFEHLASIYPLGQIIVLENIDPPENIEDLAHVHLFYGNTGEGRYGLFPVSTNV